MKPQTKGFYLFEIHLVVQRVRGDVLNQCSDKSVWQFTQMFWS